MIECSGLLLYLAVSRLVPNNALCNTGRRGGGVCIRMAWCHMWFLEYMEALWRIDTMIVIIALYNGVVSACTTRYLNECWINVNFICGKTAVKFHQRIIPLCVTHCNFVTNTCINALSHNLRLCLLASSALVLLMKLNDWNLLGASDIYLLRGKLYHRIIAYCVLVGCMGVGNSMVTGYVHHAQYQ